MIVDYLIDYEYIAKELRKQPVDSQFFMGLKLLCDAVEFQNARLIVDAGEEPLCLAQLRRLGEELDATKGGGLQKKALLEKIYAPKEAHWYRRVENYEQLFQDLKGLDPASVFRIGTFKRAMTLEAYFLAKDKEKKRIRWAQMHHFEKGKRSDGRQNEFGDYFEDLVKRFGCADHEFTIVDRYGIGEGKRESLERSCQKLCHWVRMLSNDFQNKATFDIWVTHNPSDEKKVYPLEELTKELSTTLPKVVKCCQKLYEQKGRLRQTIVLHIVNGSGRELQVEAFHDRFVCSKTRLMSIGKGLGTIDNGGIPTCINIQYCGLNRSPHWLQTIQGMQEAGRVTVQI